MFFLCAMKITSALFLLSAILFVPNSLLAQHAAADTASKSLPLNVYQLLRDSADYIDVVFYPPYTSSMSLEGKNVRLFSSLIEPVTTQKQNLQRTGYISWLWRGRELVFADFFLGEKESYLVVKKEEQEFVNRISPQGAQVLKQNAKTK